MKPFWKIEYDYLEARDNFVSDCQSAETLQDAMLCGANMTYLDGERVGYLREDETFEKCGKWKKSEVCMSDIKVEFDGLAIDADGYTIAHFKEVK